MCIRTFKGVTSFIGSEVCACFVLKIGIPGGGGVEKEGNANFETKHTEALTPEIFSAFVQ